MLVTITQKYINKMNVRFLVTLSMNLHFTCNIFLLGVCRQHSIMRTKKRYQVMPFYRNTLNARLSHSPLTCKFNDIPLWQKMNTESVVLTSVISGINRGGMRFCITASQSTLLKNGCIRMECALPRAPRRHLGSLFSN